jgi:hypothetical protein
VLLEYFYCRLEKVSDALGVTLEMLIDNVMILALKELESMAQSQKYQNHQTNTRPYVKISAKSP